MPGCRIQGLAEWLTLAGQDIPAEPLPLAVLVAPHPCRISAVGPVVPPVVVAVRREAAVVVERPLAAVPVHHHVGAATADAAALAVAADLAAAEVAETGRDGRAEALAGRADELLRRGRGGEGDGGERRKSKQRTM